MKKTSIVGAVLVFVGQSIYHFHLVASFSFGNVDDVIMNHLIVHAM